MLFKDPYSNNEVVELENEKGTLLYNKEEIAAVIYAHYPNSSSPVLLLSLLRTKFTTSATSITSPYPHFLKNYLPN